MVPLLVLLTFLIIASTYALVQRSKHKELMASLGMSGTPLPDYQYTPGHLWLDQLASGRFRIGLDELVAKFIGQPTRIHLVDDGELIREGEPLVILTRDNKDLTLRAPADMRVFRANQSLRAQPETVSLDPYHRSWLYHVSLENKDRKVNQALRGERAKEWMKQEMERFKQFITLSLNGPEPVPNTAYDGGTLVDGLLSKLDQSHITNFEQQFLSPQPKPE